jgi:hypothetical protein
MSIHVEICLKTAKQAGAPWGWYREQLSDMIVHERGNEE